MPPFITAIRDYIGKTYTVMLSFLGMENADWDTVGPVSSPAAVQQALKGWLSISYLSSLAGTGPS